MSESEREIGEREIKGRLREQGKIIEAKGEKGNGADQEPFGVSNAAVIRGRFLLVSFCPLYLRFVTI